MSSMLIGHNDEWSVPNNVFWAVLSRGVDVGGETAHTENEAAWVATLRANLDYGRNPDSPIQTYSPDLMVNELFSRGEEMAWWSKVFLEVALHERRAACDDERAFRSCQLIWAMYGLSRFLKYEAWVRDAPVDE